MLNVALEKEKDIDAYMKENWSSLLADYLSKPDWDTLRPTVELLKCFKEATLFAQGDRGLLHETLLNLDLLNRLLARNLFDETKKSEFKKRVRNA